MFINQNKFISTEILSVKCFGAKYKINDSLPDNNKIIIKPSDENNITIDIFGKSNKIIIGHNLSINKEGGLNICIKGNNNTIIIGDNNYINRRLNIIIFSAGPGIINNNSSVSIKNENIFNGNVSILNGEEKTNILIGNYNLFANNITLRTSNNHTIYDIDNFDILSSFGNVYIKNHNWIADNTNFMPLGSIESNSVVAMNSLVNKKFSQSNILLAGSPARIKRTNINWIQTLFNRNSKMENLYKKILKDNMQLIDKFSSGNFE